MREAVIVAVARTPIAKSYRGAFNNTSAQELASCAIGAAVHRAYLDPGEIEDVIFGCAMQQGTQGLTVARQAALRAGLAVTTPGMSIERGCASGLMAISAAAKAIVQDGLQIVVAGGVESISLVQNEHQNGFRVEDTWVKAHFPAVYMSMLETAEVVADRYSITRDEQDEYALSSQQKAAAALAAGVYDAEIEPVTVVKTVVDRATGESSLEAVTLDHDEGIRADTTLEGLLSLKPVFSGGQQIPHGKYITAGNASQLSDGAAALVLMEADAAQSRGIEALGAIRGLAVAGCEPDEMGIGPVHAVPKLLERHGLTVDDIDLWELNEAFASQVLYCRDAIGIPQQLLNVSGGAIALGHPYGMTGARAVGHLVLEGQLRGARWGVVTMCVGGGQGAAGLIEIFGKASPGEKGGG